MIRVPIGNLIRQADNRPPGYAAELKPALLRQEGDVLIFDTTHPAWQAAMKKYAALRQQGNPTQRTRKPCGCGK